MEFQRELAKRLKAARVSANMTQYELAQKIGVSQGCICMYENSHRTPNIRIVSCISNALDMSLDELIPSVACQEPKTPENQTSIFDLIEKG